MRPSVRPVLPSVKEEEGETWNNGVGFANKQMEWWSVTLCKQLQQPDPKHPSAKATGFSVSCGNCWVLQIGKRLMAAVIVLL